MKNIMIKRKRVKEKNEFVMQGKNFCRETIKANIE